MRFAYFRAELCHRQLLRGLGVALLFCPPLLVGCGKNIFSDKEEAPPASTATVVAQTDLNDESVKIHLQGTDTPNEYLLIIGWPPKTGPVRISYGDEVKFQTNGNINRFQDTFLSAKSLNLKFEQLNAGSKDVVFSLNKKVLIPEDYFFSGKVILKEDLDFKGGRLFFQSHTTVFTMDKNVKFDVDEIISENGSLETFPQNTSATWDASGRSGGNVSIRAKKAVGMLHVFLRGENGGAGRYAPKMPFVLSCNAGNGGNGGDSGTFSLDVDNSDDFKIEAKAQEGVGGAKGLASEGDRSAPRETINIPPCPYGQDDRHGMNGQPGNLGKVCIKLGREQEYVCK